MIPEGHERVTRRKPSLCRITGKVEAKGEVDTALQHRLWLITKPIRGGENQLYIEDLSKIL